MRAVRGTHAGKARWLVIFALLFCSSAVPAFADPEPPPFESNPEESPIELPGAHDIAIEIAKAEREEEQHEEWLASPEAVEQREASWLAYGDFGPAESEALLLSTFAERLAVLNDDPARILSDAQLVRPIEDTNAVIREEDENTLLEGEMPVRTEDEYGDLHKVDVDLEATAEGYETANGISDLELPDSAEDPIEVGEEGFAISQVGAEATDLARPFGDKNLFYPEVLPDTDLMVAATATGAEIFNLLRSKESPEELRFDIEVPEGAVLREDGRGGAEVLREDEVLTKIPKPIAFDAQRTMVPVELEVEGSQIVLHVAHREGDYAAPILVDPIVEDWVNASWYWGQKFEGLNAWQWYANHPNIKSSWCCWGAKYVGLLAVVDANVFFGPEQYGQWSYSVPNIKTYIEHAWISPFYRYDESCKSAQPHDYDGLWNQTLNKYNPVYTNQALTGASSMDGWGHAFIIGIGTGPPGVWIPCARHIYAGGVALWLNDEQYPAIDSVTGAPTGWVSDASAFTINAATRDDGLGVQFVTITPQGMPIIQDQVGCSGLYGSRCPTTRNSAFKLTGTSFDEGVKEASLVAQDPLGRTSGTYKFTTWVDRTPPEVTLDGQLAKETSEVGSSEVPAGKGDELSLPVYNLKIEAKDGSKATNAQKRSGVKSIEVQLDGVKKQSWEQTCFPDNSCPMTQTYQLKLDGVAAGQHTLKVIVTDWVGKKRERNIEFEYIPATGIKDEYVMQYFPLPDGQGTEAEEEFPDRPELAVNVMNGNLVYREKDVEIEGFGADLEVERYYNSMLPSAQNSEWGDGWTLSETPDLEPFDTEAPPGPDQGRMTSATGAIEEDVNLPVEVGTKYFDPQLQATITKEAGGGYELVDETGESGTAIAFDKEGRVQALRSGSYATVDYTYAAGVLDEIAVKDPSSATIPSEEAAPSYTPTYQSSFSGTGEKQLKAPAGIAIDAEGNLWVADKGNNRIQKFDSNGEQITKFGALGSGAGAFNRPTAVALDSKGNIWVVDADNHRIQKFDPKGGFIAKVGAFGSGEGKLNSPEAIAIDAQDNVWVADTLNGRLQVFSESGAFIKVVSSNGPAKEQLGKPADIDFDPEGNLWVADREYNRVVGFTTEGKFIRQFGSVGSGNGQFNHPDAIDVDPLGGLWVGDRNNNRVQRFDDEGNYFEQFGAKGSGPGQFSFAYPMGIVVDSKGTIWVADQGNNRVQKWAIENPATPGEEDNDPSVDISTTSGLISGLSGEAAGTHTYPHTSDDLTAHKGPAGETKYVYDAAGRMTKVTLANGTFATITYNTTYGRVASVTVDPAGPETAKKTSFTYQDEPSRRTTVIPPGKPVITYDIGEDGSVLKWWNAIKPPEFDDRAGSLYANKETATPITSGDHNLVIQAYSAEGIASIQMIANGTHLVDEKTCVEVHENPTACLKVQSEWITNTGDLPPGILNLEVVIKDRLDQSSSERFWVNIPPPPPPLAPGTPVPPKFADVLNFREEHGLDIDLNPNTDELEINDRVFSTIGDWWTGVDVARASKDRWGVPLADKEVAELEDRIADFRQAGSALPGWVAINASASYAGYYIDEREGGVIHVGFTSNQTNLVAALIGSGALSGADRLAPFLVTPIFSLTQLEALEQSVLNVAANAPNNLITTVGINVKSNAVSVGATNVSEASALITNQLGPQPVSVYYEPVSPEPRGRERDEGSVRAGDLISGGYFEYECTAGFGAWDNVTDAVTGGTMHRLFLLSAAHCFWPQEKVRRRNPETEKFRPFGIVTRSGSQQGSYGGSVNGYNTDAVAIRVSDPILAPRQIYTDESSSPLDVHGAVQSPGVGVNVCHSGVTTNEKLCGPIVGPPRTFTYKPATTVPFPFIEICYRAVSRPGDSGGPVWVEGTHNAVGLISYGWNFFNDPKNPSKITGGVTCLTPLRPVSGRPEAPGALEAPGMGTLSIMTRTP